jgi:hypothetical protein
VGALFAIAMGIVMFRTSGLEGAENVIIPVTLVVTMLSYPLCQNLTIWLLWATGLVFRDPPAG